MKTFWLWIVLSCMYTTLVFASGVERDFSFIVFGDNRPHTCPGIFQPEIFKTMIQEMNRHTNEAVFAVNLGDIVKGDSHTWLYELQLNEYINCIKHLQVPIHHVPGNHEIRGSSEHERIYEKKIGKTYYSFTYEDCLFIILDTEEPCHEGNIEGKQLVWLENELHKSASMKFVFLHRPFFTVGRASAMKEEHFRHLFALFRENGVNTVFAGHEHFFNRNEQNGIVQVISGGGGAPLYSPPASGMKIHHFCIVTIKGENVEVKVIPVLFCRDQIHVRARHKGGLQ